MQLFTTSGLINIPLPPPKGLSSTEPCLSIAKSLILTTSNDQIFFSLALRYIPISKRPGKNSGYKVNIFAANIYFIYFFLFFFFFWCLFCCWSLFCWNRLNCWSLFCCWRFCCWSCFSCFFCFLCCF